MRLHGVLSFLERESELILRESTRKLLLGTVETIIDRLGQIPSSIEKAQRNQLLEASVRILKAVHRAVSRDRKCKVLASAYAERLSAYFPNEVALEHNEALRVAGQILTLAEIIQSPPAKNGLADRAADILIRKAIELGGHTESIPIINRFIKRLDAISEGAAGRVETQLAACHYSRPLAQAPQKPKRA